MNKNHAGLILVIVFIFGAIYFSSNLVSAENEENSKNETALSQGDNKEDNETELEDVNKNESEQEDIDSEENEVDELEDVDKDEDDQEDIDSEADDSNDDENVSGSHRNNIENVIKVLERVAEKEKKISEKAKEIAKEKNESKDIIVDAVKKEENRSKFKTFLLGSDYKNLGVIRSEIVKANNSLEKLIKISDEVVDPTVKEELTAQSDIIKAELTKLENFVNVNESKFSLLGWFVKMFN